MGYKLWSTGELLTSPDLNNYLAKQVVIVCTSGTRPPSPIEGMTIFETDTNMLRFYSGTAWRSVISSVPSVLIAKGTASIPNNTLTTVLWSTVIRNEFGMWSAGSSNLITVPYDGMYRVELEIRWASQATVVGNRAAQIHTGGVEQMSSWLAPTTALNATSVSTICAHTMGLTAGEQIEGKVFQTSGGALDMVSNSRILVQMLSEG